MVSNGIAGKVHNAGQLRPDNALLAGPVMGAGDRKIAVSLPQNLQTALGDVGNVALTILSMDQDPHASADRRRRMLMEAGSEVIIEMSSPNWMSFACNIPPATLDTAYHSASF